MDLMREYLEECKARISSESSIFVIGNESADCDSIVSALCYAYLSKNPAYIPVVNNRPEVVALRGEVVVALSSVGLAVGDLIFLDTVLERGMKPLQVFLVDHNEPSAQWDRLGFDYAVHGIIDHHEDVGLFQSVTPRIIKTCASTVSMIIDQQQLPIPAWMHKILLTALTFDTTNWTWKVTDFDVQMGCLILPECSTADELHHSCSSLMAEIESSGISEASVSPVVLLRKDYKLYKKGSLHYAITVIHTDLQTFNVLSAMETIQQEDQLEFVVILSAVRPPGQYSFYQQFAILHKDPLQMAYILEHVEGPLELSLLQSGEHHGIYSMLNLKYSRKTVQPLIHKLA